MGPSGVRRAGGPFRPASATRPPAPREARFASPVLGDGGLSVAPPRVRVSSSSVLLLLPAQHRLRLVHGSTSDVERERPASSRSLAGVSFPRGGVPSAPATALRRVLSTGLISRALNRSPGRLGLGISHATGAGVLAAAASAGGDSGLGLGTSTRSAATTSPAAASVRSARATSRRRRRLSRAASRGCSGLTRTRVFSARGRAEAAEGGGRGCG